MSGDPESDDGGETRVTIVQGPLVGPVLRRVVGMLAARADLPLDRLDDAVLVADVIAARAAPYTLDGHVSVAMRSGPRTLDMRVGPLKPGGASELVVDARIPDVGNVIERLADELDVQSETDADFLRVSLAYPG